MYSSQSAIINVNTDICGSVRYMSKYTVTSFNQAQRKLISIKPAT